MDLNEIRQQITSFDPTMAKAYGLNTSLIHYLLMFFLTLVAVVSLPFNTHHLTIYLG